MQRTHCIGDRRAFELVMRRHTRMLFRLGRSIRTDEVEPEEALQEAYFAAYRNIGSFKGGAKLSTWRPRGSRSSRWRALGSPSI